MRARKGKDFIYSPPRRGSPAVRVIAGEVVGVFGSNIADMVRSDSGGDGDG